MNQERLETTLEKIRHLLSHLQGEVTTLENRYSEMLLGLRRAEQSSSRDDLTGLLRKGSFDARFKTTLDLAKKRGENCGVLMVDIDFFKQVNDNHGHPTGDEVIRRVAQLLETYMGPQSFAGRMGGEEFAIVVPGNDAEVLGVAEFIRRGAERMYGPVIGPDGAPRPGVVWKCTVSLGMASTAKEGHDPQRLIAAADAALYAAKRSGRNQVKAA
jgi:diguanylate cyclase (GGDEF)-like protein